MIVVNLLLLNYLENRRVYYLSFTLILTFQMSDNWTRTISNDNNDDGTSSESDDCGYENNDNNNSTDEDADATFDDENVERV
jgi:hypothetical protein